MCLILKIFRKNLWWRGRPSLFLWSNLQESLKRAQEGEWNSFQSERGRGGGLKSDRGSPWRIVCSAVFLSNMESEVSVPLSLLQRAFEPHREGSWQSQTPPLPLCYLLEKSDGWIMKLSKLLPLHIPQPHVGALSVSVAHFGLIFFPPNRASVLFCWCSNKFIEFPSKCSVIVPFCLKWLGFEWRLIVIAGHPKTAVFF